LARDVAVDGDVVGGIHEHNLGLSPAEEERVRVGFRGIHAKKAMRPDQPQIAGARDHGGVQIDLGDRVGGIGFVGPRIPDQEINLRGLESDHLEVKAEIELGQVLELESKEVSVPAGVLGELVVGDYVGADLRLGEMLEPKRRNGRHSEELRRAYAPVARDHGIAAVDEDGIGEPERLDRGRDLADLLFGMRSGISLP
jgi:hypothetical protein